MSGGRVALQRDLVDVDLCSLRPTGNELLSWQQVRRQRLLLRQQMHRREQYLHHCNGRQHGYLGRGLHSRDMFGLRGERPTLLWDFTDLFKRNALLEWKLYDMRRPWRALLCFRYRQQQRQVCTRGPLQCQQRDRSGVLSGLRRADRALLPRE